MPPATERLADLVESAAYGCVLVIAAVAVVGVSEISEGYGAELVGGVGVATWLAHLYAHLLAGHVRHPDPFHRSEIARAMAQGAPILVAPVLPAAALLLGRTDVVTVSASRVLAIVVGFGQLLAVGAYVARVAPGVRRRSWWTFAALTVLVGLLVVGLTVALGH